MVGSRWKQLNHQNQCGFYWLVIISGNFTSLHLQASRCFSNASQVLLKGFSNASQRLLNCFSKASQMFQVFQSAVFSPTSYWSKTQQPMARQVVQTRYALWRAKSPQSMRWTEPGQWCVLLWWGMLPKTAVDSPIYLLLLMHHSIYDLSHTSKNTNDVPWFLYGDCTAAWTAF